MTIDAEGRQATNDLVLVFVCLVTYLAADLWAKSFSLPGTILIWFPPAGVAIGFCYLRPRLVVVVAVAELIATTWITDAAGAFGIAGLLLNSVGIAAAYGFAGWSLRRLRLDPRLRTPEDLLRLAFACLVLGPVPAAAVGVAVQGWVGLVSWSDFWQDAGIFWLGDAVGAVCVAPTILLIGSALQTGELPPMADFEKADAGRLLVSLEYAVPAAVGVGLMHLGGEPLRFSYLAFIPVVLIAVRRGVAGAAYSAAGLGAVLSVGAHQMLQDTINRSDFQLLMLTLSLTGLIVGAVVSAQRDVLAEKTRISEIMAATPDLVATISRNGTVQYLNRAGRRLMGLPESGAIEPLAFELLPDELARDLMRDGMRIAQQEGSWSGENRLQRGDGHILPVSQVLVAHQHPGDDDVSFSTVCRDVSEAHELSEQLRHATLYDDATGLPNRVLLTEQLQHLIRIDEHPMPAAVLFCAVDHLEHVHETRGFAAADALLASIAERIQASVRGSDLVARYGLAQFVVVTAGTDEQVELERLAGRLLQCFAGPLRYGDQELRTSGSVGVALVGIDSPPLDALRSAEIALHRAREAGGARFTLFDPTLEERSRRRLEAQADLQQVLDAHTWWLAYQPIVDAETRKIRTVEALLRFPHPGRDPVSPFELIRQAEHAGTIVQLGRQILERAVNQAKRWQDAGYEFGVGVNVSARQLREPGFVDEVCTVLADAGLEARWLTIELTETVIVANEHDEIAALERLRALGCCVALDDFGTGYSSLSELHDLPIDIVKLDQAFIRSLDESPRAASMVEAVVRLARALDLVVVAEGVERDAQIAVLRDLHCHLLQGFALCRPLDPAAFQEFLQATA